MDTLHYNKNWLLWQDMKKSGPTSRHTRRIVLNALKQLAFTSVADIGCGTGLLLSRVKKMSGCQSLSGIDISSTAIAAARDAVPEGTFFVHDITLPGIPITADVTLCCDVLEHIEDYKKTLAHIRCITKKFFILTTIQGTMRAFEKNVGHVRNFKKTELVEALHAQGFKPIRIIEWGFPFYSPLYRSLFNLKTVENFSYGSYGVFKKIVAAILYGLFFCNVRTKGDTLIIISETVEPPATAKT